jgi:hypothetical protein
MLRFKQLAHGLVLGAMVASATCASAQPPGKPAEAERKFREFEKRIQGAKSATIIYVGVEIVRSKGEEISRKLYGGSWQVKPGGNLACVERGQSSHVSTGVKVLPDNNNPFLVAAPGDFFIGTITRHGFFSAATEALDDCCLARKMNDFRFEPRQEGTGAATRIAYRLGLKEGLACDVVLSIDDKSLAPLRRVARWKVGDQEFEATEDYRGFSLAEIPEPFDKNILPHDLRPKLFFLSGQLTALKGRADWPAPGSQFRAETEVRLDFDGARITLARASEFTIERHILHLTRGHISVVYAPLSELNQIQLGSVTFWNSGVQRCIFSATPDRVIAEEGWPHNDMREGVEYRIVGDKLQPQKERTLPPAVRAKDKILFRLDLSDPKSVEGKLRQGKLIQRDGRPVLAPVKKTLIFDPGKDDLLTVKPTTALRFRYFCPDNDQGFWNLYLFNWTKKKDSEAYDCTLLRGHWNTVTIPIVRRELASLGDRCGAIRWEGGEFFIDRLEVVELEP